MPTDEPDLEISCREVHDQLAGGHDLLLIDCREAEEHAVCSIPEARLLPMSELPARVDALRADFEAGGASRPVVVLCHHGMRSAQVAMWLRGQGLANAQSMAGGIDRWSEEIDPSVPRY